MRQSDNYLALHGNDQEQKQLQKKLSKVTQEFHQTFDYSDIESTLFSVMNGWISSEFIEQRTSIERVNLFGFFLEIGKHFQLTTKHHSENKDELFPLFFYEQIISTDLKKSKKYIKEATHRFLESEFADSRELRQDVVYKMNFIKSYIKKIQLLALQN